MEGAKTTRHRCIADLHDVVHYNGTKYVTFSDNRGQRRGHLCTRRLQGLKYLVPVYHFVSKAIPLPFSSWTAIKTPFSYSPASSPLKQDSNLPFQSQRSSWRHSSAKAPRLLVAEDTLSHHSSRAVTTIAVSADTMLSKMNILCCL